MVTQTTVSQPGMLTRLDNLEGGNGLSIAAGADLALSQSTALYANVNVEAFSSGNQLGYGGGFRFKF